MLKGIPKFLICLVSASYLNCSSQKQVKGARGGSEAQDIILDANGGKSLPMAKLINDSQLKRTDLRGSQPIIFAHDDHSFNLLSESGFAKKFTMQDKSWLEQDPIPESEIPSSTGDDDGADQQNQQTSGQYNFGERGWIAIGHETITYLDTENIGFETYSLPFPLTVGGSLHAPGISVFFDEKKMILFEYHGQDARLIEQTKPTISMHSLGKCASGCKYWMSDGKTVFSLESAEAALKKVKYTLPQINGATLLSMTGALIISEKAAAFDYAFMLAENTNEDELRFFQLGLPDDKTSEGWDEIATISENFCIPCHSTDGFDIEKSWTDRKDSIIKRVAKETQTDKDAMPPKESKYYDQMTDLSRKAIVTWLENQTATDGGKFGGSGDDNTQTPISGALKTHVETHCISCHADGKNEEYWKLRKNDAISQVENGTMPKNATLTAAEKQTVVDALNAL